MHTAVARTLFLVASMGAGCVAVDADPGADDLADLPNGTLVDKLHDDGLTYAAVVQSIVDHEGFDLAVDRTALSLQWPVAGEETVALNRFGTPLLGLEDAYFHTAMDILRPSAQGDDGVYAPFAGLALPFDWWGRRGYTRVHYTSVLVVWDPESHALAFLNHSVPDTKLREAGKQFVTVEAGERIGTLAADLLNVAEADRERFRHTHFALLDGATRTALDPAQYSNYRDQTAPEVVSLYALNDDGVRLDALETGSLDLVLEVYDRDEDSGRNFEIAGLSIQVLADGVLVHDLGDCELAPLYESFATDHTAPITALIDFGHAAHQLDDSAWPGRDLDDPNRTFRYALTQLRSVGDGCALTEEDALGHIEVGEDVQAIEVTGEVWDARGNRRGVQRSLHR